MNMVKRIMGRPRQEECSPQDNALGLMHLRRLFSELCHPPRHMTQKEQEEKLYMMLPVFNRVSHNRGEGTTAGSDEVTLSMQQFCFFFLDLFTATLRQEAKQKRL